MKYILLCLSLQIAGALRRRQDSDFAVAASDSDSDFMEAAWVGAYQHGARRWRSGRDSLTCTLDTGGEAWLEDRIHRYCTEFRKRPRRQPAMGLEVLGIIMLQRGSLRAPLTPWDREARILWRYLQRPADAYTMFVDEYAYFRNRVDAHASTNTPDENKATHFNLRVGRKGLVYATDNRFHEEAMTTSGREETDGAGFLTRFGVAPEDWSKVPVLLLPRPIAELVLQGQWSTLIFLGRWHQPWWPAWPPKPWLAMTKGKHENAQPTESFTSSELFDLAYNLQEWSSKILRDTEAEGDADGRTQLQLTTYVAKLNALAESNRPAASGVAGDRRHVQHPVERLLRTFIAAVALRDRSKLPEANARMLQFLPPPLRALASEYFGDGSSRFPAWSHRIPLIVDVSVMLWHREHWPSQPRSRYIMADSSVQGRRDWLVSIIRSVDTEHIAGAFEAMQKLAAHAEGEFQRRCAEAEADDQDPQLEPCPDIDKPALFAKLYAACRVEHGVPVALGSGRTKLVHKAAALLYAFWLQCGFSLLGQFLGSITSVTTDMGTEAGFADMEEVDLRSIMPAFVTEDVMWTEEEDPMPVLKKLFDDALPISGLLHTFANAMKDVNAAMDQWAWFYGCLKTIESLVCAPQLLSRLMAHCMEGTEYARLQWKFRKRFHPLYDKRWGEVAAFCNSLSDCVELLGQVWDQRKFMDGAGNDVEGFNATEFSSVITLPNFRGYLEMVLYVDNTMVEMMASTERCPCHMRLQAEYQAHVPVDICREEFGAEHAAAMSGLSCPARGCLAPELVDGALLRMLDTSFDRAKDKYILDWRSRLDATVWGNIISDFERARAHVRYVLAMKLQHWQELPWAVCGLALLDEAAAMRWAGKILTTFDECAVDILHHAVTLKFLKVGGPLRSMVELFAAGTALRHLPGLHDEVMKLRFIPCTERSVEAPHSRILRKLSHRNHGPLSVSLAIRTNDIIDNFSSPEKFKQLASIAAEVRKVRKIPDLLGLAKHPWLRRERKLPTSGWVRLLTMIIYRCDEPGQFEKFSKAQKKPRPTYVCEGEGRHATCEEAETTEPAGLRRCLAGSSNRALQGHGIR